MSSGDEPLGSGRGTTSFVPAEVVEAYFARVPRSQVVQVYQRSDLLTRRAEVLSAWCDYVAQQEASGRNAVG